ncbi:hypothetical protein [Lichenibacterium ramalinae]|uniref:Uncharacterized protein n=1 Tax=Lichenibacterium ramalinae TaxID=2316527 RepID=A0A4Q2R6K7_9HYPH|nr:hypothetical protein [Lichenibacterium ramalinae]RYB01333.1 hypothetical protein D3272_26630 [Lichenibacterium ramalinae]
MGVPAGPFVCDGLLFRAEHLVLPWIAGRIAGMEGDLLASPTCPASAIGILGMDASGIRGGARRSGACDCAVT